VTTKNPNSPTLSEISTLVRKKPRSNGLETMKIVARNSDDGDQKDPTKKNIKKSHVVHT